MAVDVLVMPVSRYLSGDYVTGAMERAWQEQGVYMFGRPGAIEEIPPGVPLGGLQAAGLRAQLQQELQPRFAALAAEASEGPWDEDAACVASTRVEHDAFLDLRWRFTVAIERRPGWFARLLGRKAAISHFASATLFLPVPFSEPFELVVSSDGRDFECGSLPRLVEELNSFAAPPPDDCGRALAAAAVQAAEHRLPLIFDL